jgi:hypothetical protein
MQAGSTVQAISPAVHMQLVHTLTWQQQQDCCNEAASRSSLRVAPHQLQLDHSVVNLHRPVFLHVKMQAKINQGVVNTSGKRLGFAQQSLL